MSRPLNCQRTGMCHWVLAVVFPAGFSMRVFPPSYKMNTEHLQFSRTGIINVGVALLKLTVKPVEFRQFPSCFESRRNNNLVLNCILFAKSFLIINYSQKHNTLIKIIYSGTCTVLLRNTRTKICINNALTTQRLKCAHTFCCIRQH